MTTKLTKLVKEREKMFLEINGEWEKHKIMNTCSVCDSPKGHTTRKSHNRQTSVALIEGIIEMVEGMKSQKYLTATADRDDEVFQDTLLEVQRNLQKTLKELKNDKQKK